MNILACYYEIRKLIRATDINTKFMYMNRSVSPNNHNQQPGQNLNGDRKEIISQKL